MTELFVELKIPDTTAITAFHTIQRMGFKVSKLKRLQYYKFEIDGDEDTFWEKISKVDILVNANKHKCSNTLQKDEGVAILVREIGDKCSGLLSTLKNRLGLSEIQSMEKGFVWVLCMDLEDAKKVTEQLLCNPHYEEALIL